VLYGDGVGKTLLKQNTLGVYWECWLSEIDLHNGLKTVAVDVVAVIVARSSIDCLSLRIVA